MFHHANLWSWLSFAPNRKTKHSYEEPAPLDLSDFQPNALCIRLIRLDKGDLPDSERVIFLKEAIVEAASKAAMTDPPERLLQEPLSATHVGECGAGGPQRDRRLFWGTLGQVRKGLADANLEAVPYEKSFFPNGKSSSMLGSFV